MNRILYFDNAATTILHPKLSDYNNIYANPSSLHELGMDSERKIIAASATMARLLHVTDAEIIYTSGATEGNNLAIKGGAKRMRGRSHIVTTAIEHPSVTECFKYLESEGYDATYLMPDKNGNINMDSLLDSISSETVLVSLFYVNNETGTINDIEGFASAVKAKNRKTLFHTDAVQAFGKLPISLKNVDLMSFSAHKIHGPKGSGGLYVKKGISISPLFHGGGQQGNIRPGTENIQGILGLSGAFELAYDNMEDNLRHAALLKEKVLEIRDIGGIYVNGDKCSPYILNISIDGIKGEILLNALSAEGIYVSTGSACHTRRSKQNVITQIAPERADSALRISFSSLNTLDECDVLTEALRRNILKLRKHGKYRKDVSL